MQKIQIRLFKTDKEWVEFCEKAKNSNNLNDYIRSRILSKVRKHKACEPCRESNEIIIRRHFGVTLPDDVIANVKCKADSLGIPYNSYLSFLINEDSLPPSSGSPDQA